MVFPLRSDTISLTKFVSNILPVVFVGGLATAILLSLVSFSNYVDSKSGPQTEPLLLHLDSFSVSNLKVSKSSFSAQWDAKLTFKNRNGGLKITIHGFDIFVCCKECEVPLSCASVDEMHIDPKKQRTVRFRFDRRSGSCGYKESEVVKQMSEHALNSGEVSFRLRMEMRAFYGIRLLGFGTTVILTPNCPDLNVKFVGQRGQGKTIGHQNCSIPLPKLF